MSYVYAPCGGSASALVATLAVSTLLHGTHRAWLVWGAIQCAALLAERAVQGRRPPLGLSRLHPHLRAALVQCATMSTLLVQVPGVAAGGSGCSAWQQTPPRHPHPAH